MIFRLAYRITGDRSVSEELCQETFMRYYRNIGKLAPGDESRYWLIRVIKNLSYNYERNLKKEKNAYIVYKEEFPLTEEENAGERKILEETAREEVQALLKALPPKWRIPLILREYENMNYRQIAEALKLSESNVKIRIFRAREKLRDLLLKEKKNELS